MLTWLVAVCTYLSWFLLVIYGNSIPIWALFLLGGYVVCLHGSLQHEAVHNRPSKRKWINTLLVYPPLAMWYPYTIYRQDHTQHHECEILTDVDTDPESLYFAKEQWDKMNGVTKFIHRINFLLAGRLIIGPFVSIYKLWKTAAQSVINGNYRDSATWIVHFSLCACIFVFAYQTGGLPPWKYALCFALPGISLTLLRSYTEHRWAASNSERSIIVEGSLLTQLLYLNNNFHYLHHEDPGIPWYELRSVYQSKRDAILERNGNFMYRGYNSILVRIFQDKLIDPVHPNQIPAKIV